MSVGLFRPTTLGAAQHFFCCMWLVMVVIVVRGHSMTNGVDYRGSFG